MGFALNGWATACEPTDRDSGCIEWQIESGVMGGDCEGEDGQRQLRDRRPTTVCIFTVGKWFDEQRLLGDRRATITSVLVDREWVNGQIVVQWAEITSGLMSNYCGHLSRR